MRNLLRKQKQKIVPAAVFFLLLGGFLLGAAPGGSEDPLVTRSWVDQYAEDQIGPLEDRVNALRAQLDLGTELCFWIGNTTMTIGGIPKEMDVAPALQNNRTMLPLRYVGEAVGAEFRWDNTAKKATYEKDGATVELWIGRTAVRVDGVMGYIDTPPLIVNSRTMVPMRFVMETLGAEVEWEKSDCDFVKRAARLPKRLVFAESTVVADRNGDQKGIGEYGKWTTKILEPRCGGSFSRGEGLVLFDVGADVRRRYLYRTVDFLQRHGASHRCALCDSG